MKGPVEIKNNKDKLVPHLYLQEDIDYIHNTKVDMLFASNIEFFGTKQYIVIK